MSLTPKQTIKGTIAETQSIRGSMKEIPPLDNTLTKEGYAADAKAVGEALKTKAPISHTEDKGNPHGVTASQVGARPDTWTPTAEDVGARPNTWTPTASEVGARPDTWMPTAADVGAAPVGYGLGEINGYQLTAADDVNNVIRNGVYWWGDAPINAPLAYCAMRVFGGVGAYCVQEIITGNLYHNNVVMRRYTGDGASGWCPWEYVNPPMLPGVEYRTTERFNGKPVYCRQIDGGTLPIGTKSYKVANNASPFHVFGPSIMTVNFGGNIPSTLQSDNVISCFVNGDSVLISCGGDRSSIPFFFVVKYTKTTD